ncbi:hypothetical protein H6F44_04595 [Pseudanabaena sp. FACHB-1277]|uniref:Uncharacterized protein n=1 Tax=Pseudanabaena cinerea FACHB-1277 TaxID=2949581 RepID=A0A926Z5A5_9CYAN|nr:hypothetical protein [Pseudanabaena cinerea]MBD2149407.1 hypothetical protein [Pseudanabaena cinerea FACHB-1277]
MIGLDDHLTLHAIRPFCEQQGLSRYILEQFRQEATSTRYLGDKFEYLDRFPITV